MSKHTPGPWNAAGKHIVQEDGGVVAYVTAYAKPTPRQLEDARLIAAAPDLLRELEHLVRLVEPCVMDGRASIPGLATFNGARAAIAKAKGEA